MLAGLLALGWLDAVASDACSTRAITARAGVTVSDGSSFDIETWYHAANVAAIRHITEDNIVTAVEGPIGWVSVNDEATEGSDRHRHFALGHQLHALLLHFPEIVLNLRSSDSIDFAGSTWGGQSGDFPFGGTIHLIEGPTGSHPIGFVLEVSNDLRIENAFFDWRDTALGQLPHHIRINDGDRTFDYRFTDIDMADRHPLWFHEAVEPPAIDAVQIYRLHRRLLAAHCTADADMLADLSAPQVVVASRGELLTTTPDETRERFASVFGRVRYTNYVDIQEPVIEVAENGDLGWAAVNVRAVGQHIESGTAFDDQWAWVMMLKKIDGRWLHAGNASNIAN